MVHRAGLAILRQQCGQWGDSQRSISWRCLALPVGMLTRGRSDMQADTSTQLWVSALDKGIMQTCRHIRKELACYEHKRQASLHARPPRQSGTGSAQLPTIPKAKNSSPFSSSQNISTAGCGVAASGSWGQHRRVSPTVQLGGRRCRTHCCHTVAPAARRFTSRSPLGRRHRNPQAPARSGATAARRTNRSRWSPSGSSAGPLQPLAVHLYDTSFAEKRVKDLSMTSSPGRKTVSSSRPDRCTKRMRACVHACTTTGR